MLDLGVPLGAKQTSESIGYLRQTLSARTPSLLRDTQARYRPGNPRTNVTTVPGIPRWKRRVSDSASAAVTISRTIVTAPGRRFLLLTTAACHTCRHLWYRSGHGQRSFKDPNGRRRGMRP